MTRRKDTPRLTGRVILDRVQRHATLDCSGSSINDHCRAREGTLWPHVARQNNNESMASTKREVNSLPANEVNLLVGRVPALGEGGRGNNRSRVGRLERPIDDLEVLLVVLSANMLWVVVRWDQAKTM
jgi:hypothetical protein